MRKLLFFLLFFLLSTQTSGAGQVVFQDDFSGDLSLWNVCSNYNNPVSFIDASDGNPTPCFNTNNQGSYGNGAITKQSFLLRPGLTVSADIKETPTFAGSGWIGLVETTGTSFVAPDPMGGTDIVGIGPYQDYSETEYRVLKDSGERESYIDSFFGPEWHNYKFVIQSDYTVKFYVDGLLKYSSTNPVATAYQNQEVYVKIGRRKGLHDTVVVSQEAAEYTGDAISLREGGVLNGSGLTVSDAEITVTPGESISGTVKIDVYNQHAGTAIFPVAWAPNWAPDNSAAYVEIAGWAATGHSNYDVSITATAPTTPGTYYLIFACSARYGSDNLMASMPGSTNPGASDWNDGNDIADADSAECEFAMANNYMVHASDVQPEGQEIIGANCVRVVVLNEDAGLIAYYPFNGNANDESGNGHDGIEHGSIVLTSDRYGNSSSAYAFDGVNDYIEIAHDSDFNFDTQFTISAWILPTSWDRNTWGSIYSDPDSTGWHPTVSFWAFWDHDQPFGIGAQVDGNSAGSGGYHSETDRIFSLNQWHLVSMVFDNKNVKYYVDGTIQHEATQLGNPPQNTLPQFIGIFRVGDERYFQGKIDEVRVYNRSLSSTEVQSLYGGEQACPSTIDPGSEAFAAAGGGNSVSVDASDESCAWVAVSNDNWISIDSGASGIGDGMVGYTVDANNTGYSRSGSLTIAGNTFTVNQAGLTPTVDWSAETRNISENAGQVTLTASLNMATDLEITVPFTVSGTAAGGGVDHDLADGSFVISAGELSGSITFNINDDLITEPSETVIVTMGDPVNAVQGTSVTVQTITIVDNDGDPEVLSITRLEDSPSNASSVDFFVVFSQPVTGVDIEDFSLDVHVISGAAVLNVDGLDVDGGSDLYIVTVSTGTGDGTLSIDVTDNGSIIDAGSNALSGPYTSGEVYTIDKTMPEIIGLEDDSNPAKSKEWTWSANEDATYRFAVDQNPDWVATGPFDQTTSKTMQDVDGTWYLHVQAMDIAGNVGNVKTASAVFDNSTMISIDDNNICSISDSVTITGTMEANASVEVTCDTATVAQVTYPATDTWQVLLSGLQVGDNSITATVTDIPGNTASDSATVRYSTPDKVDVNVGTGSLLADGIGSLAVTITVKDENDAPVCIGTPITVGTDLGELSATDLVTDDSGQVTCALKASSDLGTATISVYHNSGVIGTGQVTMVPGPITRLVFTSEPQSVYVGYESNFIYIETQDDYGHAVKADENIRIVLSSDSGTSYFATPDNNWQYQKIANIIILANSSQSYFIYKNEQVGTMHIIAKENPNILGLVDASQQIIVENIPDVVASLGGVPDAYQGYTRATNATITVGGEGVIKYKYKLDSNDWSSEKSVSNPISLSSLTEDSHTIYVRGISQYTEQPEDNPTSATWTVDVTAPQTHALPAGGTYKEGQQVVLECSDQGGCGCDRIYFTTDGSTPTTDSQIYDAQSPIGINADTTLRFFGVDYLGNEETPAQPEVYLIDTVAPSEITITKPVDGAWVKPYSIEGTAVDNESGIQKVEIQLSVDDDGLIYLNDSNNFTPVAVWIEAEFSSESGTWQYYLSPQWREGKQYTLKARATDKAGNTTTPTIINFYYGDAKLISSVTCNLAQSSIMIGDILEISGDISDIDDPAWAPAISTPVSVGLVSPIIGSQPTFFNAYTTQDGKFTLTLPCTALTREGEWSVFTKWFGDDDYSGAESTEIAFNVSKADTSIKLSLSSQSIKLDDTVDISGIISSSGNCDNGRYDLPIKIVITGPPEEEGGVSISKSLEIETSDEFGHFVYENYTGFDHLGVWTVRAEFTQNIAYNSSASDTLQVRVLETAGYAIIVEGKLSEGQGLDAHNKTTNLVHDVFGERDLTDDDMMYFNYNYGDDSKPGYEHIDALPTQDGIQDAVTGWAKDKMNAKPANLYIVMVDHGIKDKFYIDQGKDVNNEDLETITSGEMAQWLDNLQAGLNVQAKNQQIIVILGYCHSGSFIKNLQGENRIIISSAKAEEVSYKGPEEHDGIRGGEYFVDQFFKDVRSGLSIQECYTAAAGNTEEYTKSNKKDSNSNYYTPTEQHPQIFNQDLAANTYIGVSTYSGNAPGDVSIIEQTDTVFLDVNENSADLWAKVDDSERLLSLWIEVKEPGFAPDIGTGEDHAEQLEMDLYTQQGLQNYNSETKRYEWNNQAIFNDPGTYQVMYFAEDDQTHNLSNIRETMVYKAKEGNQPPENFNLIEPIEGQSVLTKVAFTWNETSDPDGDSLTYTLMVSEDESDFSSAIVVPSIETNFYLFDGGLADLHTYYWKVLAVDGYGAVTESPVTSFSTDNTNSLFSVLTGRIYNSLTGTMIQGATIRLATGVTELSYSSGSKGQFLGQLDPGTYDFEVSADGFAVHTLAGFEIPDGKRVVQDVGLQPMQTGDLDGDNTVGLSDAVIAWQILAGIDVSGVLRSDYIASGADVNGDGKVGIEEGIYIMRMISDQ